MTLKVDLRSRSTFVACPFSLIFGVRSVASRQNFSSGWDPSLLDQIFLQGGIQVFLQFFFSPINPFIFLRIFIISPFESLFFA